MQRIKPYTTNQTTWNQILEYNNVIPMNQRQYEWGEYEIIRFINDIIKIFEEGKYIEKMGSILHYTGNKGTKEIWDGQQRTITIELLLLALQNKYPILGESIMQKIVVNQLLNDLTDQQKKTFEKYKDLIPNIKIPKLYCITPDDQEALVFIINNKYQSYINYRLVKNNDIKDLIDNNDSDNSDSDDFDIKKNICKICNVSVGRIQDFKRHLKKHDIQIDSKNKSKIYDAYDFICDRINSLSYDQNKGKELFKFIINDIDIQIYESTDHKYVSKIFDWENNRGKIVQSLDNIKNLILSNIPDSQKKEVFDKWTQYKSSKKYENIYLNINERIFELAIQIYNHDNTNNTNNNNDLINRINDIDTLYTSIIDSNDIYKAINNFYEIIDKIYAIIKEISEDRFGRLVLSSKRIALQWEGLSYCLIPIFYKLGKIDKNLILLFVKFYFRNLRISSLSINRLSYTNELIKITNLVANNIKYNYYKDIIELFNKNIDDKISSTNYVDYVSKLQFKHTSGLYLLYFYETCRTPDNYRPSLDFSLEHIIPQANKDNLKDKSNIDKIGNLTLLEKNNSDNKHKGNCSLQNKPYNKKIDSYKGSSISITRNIAEKYNKFTEDEILLRTTLIIKELNNFTNINLS